MFRAHGTNCCRRAIGIYWSPVKLSANHSLTCQGTVMDKMFAKFATATAKITGSPLAFLICVLSVVIWAATGPLFKFSETWQLVINTGTTIVTFLMVFLIQNTQNRDGAALQTKLDELIRASDAEDEFMGIETLTDKELDLLHRKCTTAAENSSRILAKAEAERKSRQGKASARKPATRRTAVAKA
jgi:low affinity Fe/Cu permease